MSAKLAVKRLRARSAIFLVLTVMLVSLLLSACGDTATPATTTSAATTAAATTSAAATTTAASSTTTAAATTTAASSTTTAAATTAASATTTQAAASGNVETVTLWTMPNTGQSVKDLQTALAPFYAANPNIKVNAVEVSWGDAFGKIQTALQTGVGPDITQVGTTWVASFGSTGGLRTFSSDEVQAMGGSAAFAPPAWATSHLVGSNDIVAIPWFVDTRVLFYRTDLVQKAGLDPTTAFKDWDTFTASLQKMKSVESGLVDAPFAITGKNDYNVIHNIMPWVWNAGGNILTSDDTKAAINTDAAVKGAEFYAGLFTQGLTYAPAIQKSVDDLEAAWRAGQIGSMIDGPWMIAQAQHTKAQDANGYADTVTGKNYGTVMIPAGPSGQHPFIGGSDLAILKSSKHQEAALKVVEYLASPAGQVAYQKLVGDVPANIASQSDPLYSSNPLYKPFFTSLQQGYSYPVIPAWGAIEQDLTKTFSTMWDNVVAGKGNAGIKSALDQAAQQINTDIASSQ